MSSTNNLLAIYSYTTWDPEVYPDNDCFRILASGDFEMSEKTIPVLHTTIHDITLRRSSYLEIDGLYALYTGRVIDEDGNTEELPEYVGFCHHGIYLSTVYDLMTPEKCAALFSQYDFICACPGKFENTLYNEYKKKHDITKLDEIIDIIDQIEPDYFDACNKTFIKRYIIPGNVFIMDREHFKELCRFAFHILKEFDTRHRILTQKDVDEYIESSWNGESDIEDVGGVVVQNKLHCVLFEYLYNIFVTRWYRVTKIATFPFLFPKKETDKEDIENTVEKVIEDMHKEIELIPKEDNKGKIAAPAE